MRQDQPSGEEICSPVVDALKGAAWAVVPGAIALIGYAAVRLAAQGDLAVLACESYMTPILAVGGAVLGAPVGARVGWLTGTLKGRGIMAQVVTWLLNGCVTGVLLANLLAFCLWFTLGDEIGVVMELDLGGMVAGSLVAVAVGLLIRSAGQPSVVRSGG